MPELHFSTEELPLEQDGNQSQSRVQVYQATIRPVLLYVFET